MVEVTAVEVMVAVRTAAVAAVETAAEMAAVAAVETAAVAAVETAAAMVTAIRISRRRVGDFLASKHLI